MLYLRMVCNAIPLRRCREFSSRDVHDWECQLLHSQLKGSIRASSMLYDFRTHWSAEASSMPVAHVHQNMHLYIIYAGFFFIQGLVIRSMPFNTIYSITASHMGIVAHESCWQGHVVLLAV